MFSKTTQPTLINLPLNNSPYNAAKSPQCYDSNPCSSKDMAFSIKCTLFCSHGKRV